VACSWILFFSYQDDARSNTHKKRLFPYITLTGWFFSPRWSVPCSVQTEFLNIINYILKGLKHSIV